jgi:hypothetical protein
MTLKEVANKALEQLRARNVIGSSQEAKLTLTTPEPLATLLNRLDARERNRLFIASDVTIQLGQENGATAVASGGLKCPRCWNYFPTLHAHGDHQVCERCLEVLSV